MADAKTEVAGALGLPADHPKVAKVIEHLDDLGYAPSQYVSYIKHVAGSGEKPIPAAEAPEPRPMNKDEAVMYGLKMLTGQAPGWQEQVDIPSLDRAAAASRQYARGIGDATTLGLANRVFDSPESAAADESLLADDPVLKASRTGGAINGALIPGATRSLAKRGMGMAARASAALQRVKGLAPMVPSARALYKTVEGLTGAMVGAGAIGAGQSIANASMDDVINGDVITNALQAGVKTATDPLTMAIGAGAGLIGGVGAEASRALRKHGTRTGEIIGNIEKGGGERTVPLPIPGREAVRGGVFDDPKLKNLPPGKKGIRQAANQGASEYITDNEAQLQKLRSEFGDKIDEILASHKKADVTGQGVHSYLDLLMEENQVAGIPADDRLHALLLKAKQMLGGVYDAKTNTWSVPDKLRVEDVLKTRKIFKKMAAFDGPVTEENRAAREIYGALNDSAKAVDPRIEPLYQAYASGMEGLKRTNDLIAGVNKPELPDRVAAQTRVSDRLARVGDETEAAMRADQSLQEAAKLNPKVAELIDRMGAAKARELSTFRLFPGHSLPIEHIGLPGLLKHNMDAAAVRLVEPFAAAAGRAPLPTAAAGANPIINARRRQQEVERKRAATLRDEE